MERENEQICRDKQLKIENIDWLIDWKSMRTFIHWHCWLIDLADHIRQFTLLWLTDPFSMRLNGRSIDWLIAFLLFLTRN